MAKARAHATKGIRTDSGWPLKIRIFEVHEFARRLKGTAATIGSRKLVLSSCHGLAKISVTARKYRARAI